jgi:phosphoribosyl 1,2-cyclic phosphodiesterase
LAVKHIILDDVENSTPASRKFCRDRDRRTFTNNQAQAAETAAALQRTDRITVVLCGVSSPLANQGAQTCTAVFVNGRFLLFDAGDGAMASMRESNFPLDALDAVFITHYHNDHYADLGDVMEWSWIFGRRLILPVHGPTGITQIVEGLEPILFDGTQRLALRLSDFWHLPRRQNPAVPQGKRQNAARHAGSTSLWNMMSIRG